MGDESDKSLSESDVYALLADRRRRLVLRILQDFSTPLTVPRLAELVCECEPNDCATDRLQVVYLSIYHTHVPKLERSEVIEYDDETGHVRPGPNFGVLVGALEATSEEDGSDWEP